MRKFLKVLMFLFIFLVLLYFSVYGDNYLNFTDISSNDFYYDSVNWGVNNNIINGTSPTTFSPTGTITRGQVLTMLYRAYNEPKISNIDIKFTDVSKDAYYYNAVIWGVNNNITNGTSFTTFSPNDNCTFAQIITFIYRSNISNKSILKYDNSSNFYSDALNYFIENNLFGELYQNIKLNNVCQRKDTIYFIYNYFVNNKNSLNTVLSLNLPEFTGYNEANINENKAYFTNEELNTVNGIKLSLLNDIGKNNSVMMKVTKDTFPTSEREYIGMVKPLGFKTYKYDCIEDKYLYNRTHLLGFMLSGLNAQKENLITGTRYLNLNMLPYEKIIASHVRENKCEVLYRVTPIYNDNEIICRGLLLEAKCLGLNSCNLEFCKYLYNVQPYVVIDYKSGDSHYDENHVISNPILNCKHNSENVNVILNTSTLKIHKLSCSSIKDIKNYNKKEYNGCLKCLLEKGYKLCLSCH